MSKHPDAKPSGFPAIAVDYMSSTCSPGSGWVPAYHEGGYLPIVWRRIRLLGRFASNKQVARK